MNIPFVIYADGGLVATHELLRRGVSKHAIRQAVFAGDIVRVRQGWYALPSLDPLAIEASRVGGQLTCVSGARYHGLSVAASSVLHVRVKAEHARLRSRTDKDRRLSAADQVRVHWREKPAAGMPFAVLPRECLRDMVYCQSPERVVAAADSALREGHITLAEWRRDIAGLPRRLRRLLARVDAESGSIIESIVRFRLEQLGYLPRLQVRINEVGRVDLLLGQRLVIELDGWEYHRSREAFEEDRRRDAVLASRGYIVLRFTYRQVTRRWSEVLGAIRASEKLANRPLSAAS